MDSETLKVIRSCTSLRTYDAKPLREEEENAITESVLLAPTAGNQMLYSMIIIRDQKKKKKLSKFCDYQVFIQDAPLITVPVADHYRWFDYYRMNGVKRYAEKRGLSFTSPAEGDLMLAVEDVMAATQNSVIATESMGVGFCYIGGMLENYGIAEDLLWLPDETFPIAMLCYGHYKQEHRKVLRKRFDGRFVVFEGSYRQLQKEEYEQVFAERVEKEFLTQNKYAAKNYAQQFHVRKMGASFSKEVTRSIKEALKAQIGKQCPIANRLYLERTLRDK